MPPRGVKLIPIAEFRRLGYVQEINRLLLHPVGLALEVAVDSETGEEKITGVWDCRDDPEGVYFDFASDSPAAALDAVGKARSVSEALADRSGQRDRSLGFVVEPLPAWKSPLTGSSLIASPLGP